MTSYARYSSILALFAIIYTKISGYYIILIGVAWLLIFLAVTWSTLRHPLRHLPSPPIYSRLLGHLAVLGSNSHSIFAQWTQAYGKTMFLRLGCYPTLVTTDIELVKLISMGKFKSFQVSTFYYYIKRRIKSKEYFSLCMSSYIYIYAYYIYIYIYIYTNIYIYIYRTERAHLLPTIV